jgi:hypothetical protein
MQLVAALNANCRYRHGEMLRWFVSEALHVMGLPASKTVPDDAIAQIHEALHLYEDLVLADVPFADILGAAYMELVSHWGKSALGQFFTPQPVARMMAAMTAPDELPTDRLLTVIDPAVGSGVMLGAFLRNVLEKFDVQGLRRISITGIDLDPVCIRMFSVQILANCSLRKLEIGEVVALHGNALGNPEALSVIAHASAPGVNALPAKAPARLVAIANSVGQRAEQLSLFDVPQAA